MIKNIIFDLGRVLINWDLDKFAKQYTDDKKLQNDIVHGIFEHNDWHTLDEGTISEEEAVKRFSNRLKLEIKSVKEIIREARKIMTLKVDTYNELLRLKEKYDIYCISNMSHKSWDVILEEHDFHKHFKDIVISAQEGIKKPDIKIFENALNRFKIKAEETVFIDDLQDNLNSANSLGIKGILFDETKECWNKLKKL